MTVQRSIARIRIPDPEQRGTGFLVGTKDDHRVLLTAHHVVETMEDGAAASADFFDDAGRVLATVSLGLRPERDAQADWALVECLDSPPPGAADLRLAVAPAVGAEWSTHGFPDLQPDGYGLGGFVRQLLGPSIQAFAHEAGSGKGGLVSGLSGAPLVVENKVVGVVVESLQTEQGGVLRTEGGTIYARAVESFQAQLGLPAALEPLDREATVLRNRIARHLSAVDAEVADALLAELGVKPLAPGTTADDRGRALAHLLLRDLLPGAPSVDRVDRLVGILARFAPDLLDRRRTCPELFDQLAPYQWVPQTAEEIPVASRTRKAVRIRASKVPFTAEAYVRRGCRQVLPWGPITVAEFTEGTPEELVSAVYFTLQKKLFIGAKAAGEPDRAHIDRVLPIRVKTGPVVLLIPSDPGPEGIEALRAKFPMATFVLHVATEGPRAALPGVLDLQPDLTSAEEEEIHLHVTDGAEAIALASGG